MKRIIIALILFLNLLPYADDGKFCIDSVKLFAQSYGFEDECTIEFVDNNPKDWGCTTDDICVSVCSYCGAKVSCDEGQHCSPTGLGGGYDPDFPDNRNPDNNNNNKDKNRDDDEPEKPVGGGSGGSIPGIKEDDRGSNDCWGVKNGTAYYDNCNLCVGGTTGRSPCKQDCNGEWGGKAKIDNCDECTGGSTGKTPCTKDCNGDLGGSAYINDCQECVGGNSDNMECDPCVEKTFTYTSGIVPVSMNETYTGKNWCGFLVLGSILGKDPCDMAADYYKRHRPDLNVSHCNDTTGLNPGKLIKFYREHGITVYGAATDECSLINGVKPSKKGVIITRPGHVYLAYRFWRTDKQKLSDIYIRIYDTELTWSWTKTVRYHEIKWQNLEGEEGFGNMLFSR